MTEDHTSWDCVRCSAKTSSGARCKRQTCKYSDMCWQHTYKIKKLRIGKSGIPNSGDGLFALRDFEPNEIIIEYGGKRVPAKEYRKGKGTYGIELSSKMVVDAKSTQSNLGRWANHCRAQDKRKKHCKGNNAFFSLFRGNKRRGKRAMINVRADYEDRPASEVRKGGIKKGEEIFVNYGSDYWREQST